MTSDSAEKTACRMNEIRHIYIHFNNRLYAKCKNLQSHYEEFGTFSFPCVSYGIKNFVEFKLQKVREIVVNNISNVLFNFLSPFSSSLGKNKKAKRFSKKVIEILEASFRKEKYPSDHEKNRLATICLISTKQVNNWFTNKRNRSKIYKGDGYLTYDK